MVGSQVSLINTKRQKNKEKERNEASLIDFSVLWAKIIIKSVRKYSAIQARPVSGKVFAFDSLFKNTKITYASEMPKQSLAITSDPTVLVQQVREVVFAARARVSSTNPIWIAET